MAGAPACWPRAMSAAMEFDAHLANLPRQLSDPLPPTVLSGAPVPDSATVTVISNYGEFSR